MTGIAVLLGVTLTLTPVKAEVPLGEAVELKVTLSSEKPDLDPKTTLVLDDRSVALAIGEGNQRWVYRRKLDKPRVGKGDGPVDKLEGTISWTPVRAGDYPLEALWHGRGGPASAKARVKVLPTQDGATALGALMQTTKGELKLRFFPEVAPNHVAHFAERVRTGFYDGLTFHRVIKGFMAQGGDPSGNGSGGPGYSIPAEFTRDKKYAHTFGRLSTARTQDPDSGGSQFFLCFDGAGFLDGQYTVLGEVFEGQQALRQIEAIGAARDPQPPRELVKITSMTLVPLPAGK